MKYVLIQRLTQNLIPRKCKELLVQQRRDGLLINKIVVIYMLFFMVDKWEMSFLVMNIWQPYLTS